MTPTDKQMILIAIIAAIPGTLAGLLAVWVAIKKNPHDIEKTDAETKKIHAETDDLYTQISDRWAEHVKELQEEVKGVRLDISQVRRENEEYRRENSDLKDWAERLVNQLAKHAPHVVAEKFIRRKIDA